MEKCSWVGKKKILNTSKAIESSTRARSEIMTINENKQHKNIFTYPVGVGLETMTHPAPFPSKLASDHIVSWSNENDLILDPFMGSGTTAKCAKILKRNYIGFEISEEYCKIARERISGLQ
jgi:site-specific DNA-methyltransferase (adenine-specific)